MVRTDKGVTFSNDSKKDDLEAGDQPSRADRELRISEHMAKIPTLDKFETENAIVMDYNTHDLATWQTYRFLAGTIFQNVILRWLVLRLLFMSLGVALGLMYFGLRPEYIFNMHFGTMNKTLNFFVGILLGFFLGSSVERWVDAVGGCLALFDSIRNLNMQFLALGVNRDRCRAVTRYGLLSCEFLSLELHMRSIGSPEDRKVEAREICEGPLMAGLEEWEKDSIEEVFIEHNRVSSQVWIWVASLIGRMAQDGDIPGMATPTYGRIMSLAQDAQEGIRQVRVSMTVQLPFIYVHTLAFLVHMNNICAAIDFGAVIARNSAGMLWFFDIHIMHSDLLAEPVKHKDLRACAEEIIAQFVTALVPALMYQAVLQIGLIMAQPFDETFGKGISVIPTRQLVNQLKSDIKLAEKMAHSVPPAAWIQPCFKPPAKKAA